MLTVRFIALALWFLVTFECWTTVASASVRAVASESGVTISIEGDGSFEVRSRVPAWQFSGNVGSPVGNVLLRYGRDLAGDYQEIEFKYRPSETAVRVGTIRVYNRRPVVVFKLKFLTPGKTSEPFLSISSYPHNLHHLT